MCADVAASVIGGMIIARSKDALDEIYQDGSDGSRRIDTALTGYGADKFEAEFKFVVDEIRTICEHNDPPLKLRSLLFSRQTTNPFPALFTVLAIALHELLVVDNLQVADYTAAQAALKDLDKRIDTSRGSTSPEDRRKNVDTIKGLLAPHLVPAKDRSLYDNQSATDIDDAMRRSEIEAPHYEFKQGMLRLDEAKDLDDGMPDKLVATICAIANNGPGRSGALVLGVADSDADTQRVADLYGITPRKVGRKRVVGVRREAEALGETLEAYFQRFKDAIANSELSEPVKSGVLASLSFNDYFGLGVLVLNVPVQSDVSTVGERVYIREGDATVEVSGKALLDVAKRF